ncbi:ABC transporter permease [Natronolimnobius baerhuensis]|uniref:ABC transporter permease n=1 Tax=Natronolimnobius baerhuensis TaxID=253108 RepID=UPI001C3C651E|nr:ABC transporter permease [Natronolimnobius baerhuensis]
MKYVVKRLLWAIPVLLGAALVAFMLVHLAPGDPVQLMLGEAATPEQIDQTREELGLNDPLYVQFGTFVTDAVQGDLGQSISTRQPVSEQIMDRIPYTLQLAGVSMVISLALAFPLGILSATHKQGRIDSGSRLAALLGISIPNFWLGIILILFVAVPISIFPLVGMTLITDDVIDGLLSTLLPAIAIGTALAALVMRILRGGITDEMNKGYVQTSRAYGIAESEIMYVHILKNAVLPTITVIGLQLGYLIGGSIIIETVFSIPGVGQLAINAIYAQDFPIVQGVILFVAVAFVAANILVDILYAYLDPRIQYDGGGQ